MDTAELDDSIETLQKRKTDWAQLALADKVGLLRQARKRLGARADDWVAASVRAKEIDPQSPWAGEEWVCGPWALAAGINGYLETLGALTKGQLPKTGKVSSRRTGQVVVRVFPTNFFDRVLLGGIYAEVWMQPGVTEANLGAQMAVFYKQERPRGKVALVLGAGNVNSIAPLDVLYRLFALGHVVLLKLNPVNEYLGPILEDIFGAFITAGYLRLARGGADVGNYLAHHGGVEEIHLTGSARTHDAIVYGAGAQGLERRRLKQPLLKKPVSSELGGIGPAVILPGKWSRADIRYQAENVVTMKLHNNGFNCVAAQVLIVPAQWDQRDEFLDAVRQLMHELPSRKAYYPGAADRVKEALAGHPEAERLGDDHSGRALIPGLDGNSTGEYCFNTEIFGPVLAHTSLPGANAAEFLTNAVRFCNERLHGTLGATIIGHPSTLRELGPALDAAIENLHYGAIGLNVWNAVAFLLAQATWGAFPGHTLDDIQSGLGVVRNSFLFERPEKTVCKGCFYPFPRSWLHANAALLPKPPWFVTNKTAHITARRITRFATDPRAKHLPGIVLAALRG